jgi:DNA (cytosine-5)-methyltransferase 1
MRLLDLFCGAGGAAMGYHRAGFDDITGVDIKPQKHYPFRFILGDALDYCLQHGAEYDAIHASPPCQAFSAMRVMANARPHADLLTPTRKLLITLGKPFVIENVEQAPMEIHPPSLLTTLNGVTLCGSMFDLQTERYQLRRHRLFESTVPLAQPACRHREDRQVVGFYGDHARTRTRIDGHHARGTDITRNDDKMVLVRQLMGIDWMVWHEANQAIPPAYTEYIGAQLLAAIRAGG